MIRSFALVKFTLKYDWVVVVVFFNVGSHISLNSTAEDSFAARTKNYFY